ncbi:fumarylacetoacetate hydrolase family protein [Pseudopedobacter beijingensis]|uniref:Fumarylacetoacetate hydrolase family protein n=1 Tax=Pseudopedobacter beijingensis TaxID=1207056 RepID=A0ABW4IH01_9SPHI
MKLFRYGNVKQEKIGVIIDEKYLDASGFGEDYTEDFFATDGINRLEKYIKENKSSLQEIPAGSRLGAIIKRPSKIICIGLNYADHAKEAGSPIPKEPIVFFKATSALCGPNDDLIIPKNSEKTDWEVELAVVIGKEASYVNEKDAMEYVAGYVLHNDYSERAYQLERGGQWVKGKSCDSFAPLGPFLATKDEIADVHNLNLWLKVNGKMMQNSSTKQLIFNIPFLIHYLSQFMTLLPGDIISTGTPHGVGLGFNPPIYLKAGDEVELGIEGLGSSKQKAVAYKSK